MVKKSFLKSLTDEEITIMDKIEEILFYNNFAIFIRHTIRFFNRLPKWLGLCWKTENWDYEGIYDFIEMQLKEMKKAQDEDTWHVEHETKRRSQQIALVLEHLKRYKNPHDYYDYPESELLPTGEYKGQTTYTFEFIDKEHGNERFEKFLEKEEKHYNKFWNLLKKWHRGWWT